MRREVATYFPLRSRLESDFPCVVSLNRDQLNKAWAFNMEEEFGPPLAQWAMNDDGYRSNLLYEIEDDARWGAISNLYYFKDIKDAMLFKLFVG